VVYADTILEAVVEALTSGGRMPSATTYATLELDDDGAHRDIEPPVVEIQPGPVEHRRTHNSERAGFETDNAGNHIGRKYKAVFDFEMDLRCLTAQGSAESGRRMAQSVRETLREYDTVGIGESLPDPNGSGTLSDVRQFGVRDRFQENDLSMAPALRQTLTELSCRYVDTYKSTDYGAQSDYITAVDVPTLDDVEQDSSTDAAIDGLTSDNHP